MRTFCDREKDFQKYAAESMSHLLIWVAVSSFTLSYSHQILEAKGASIDFEQVSLAFATFKQVSEV